MKQAKYTATADIFDALSLARLRHTTPFLYMDLARIDKAYDTFMSVLPDVGIHYAMKCNPDRRILGRIYQRGGSFEIASYAELKELLTIGVPAHEVIFSNPVKIPSDIAAAYSTGVMRFGFDSLAELRKLAEYAPGAKVFVRLKTKSADSQVPSEGKFGIDIGHAFELMKRAQQIGLRPYGISFHVGSQMLHPEAWEEPIQQSAALMKKLKSVGITVEMLDMGGGFPAHYSERIPTIAAFAKVVNDAVKAYLPYAVRLIIEPGRALVGDAGVMVATVIGVAERAGRMWAHLDVGAFNGMMESLESQNELLFPVTDSKNSAEKGIFNLTGPSCDSQDTIMFDIELSRDITVGDRIFIHTAGAYTTSYASRFNGFRIPRVYCIN